MRHFLVALICLLTLSSRIVDAPAYTIEEAGARPGRNPFSRQPSAWVFEPDSCTASTSSNGMRIELHEGVLLNILGRAVSRTGATNTIPEPAQYFANWHISPPPDVTGIALAPGPLLGTRSDALREVRHHPSNQRASGTAPVPEPATLLLLGSTLCGVAIWLRRQQRRKT